MLSLMARLESGNMLIMALSYAQKTGDIAQLTKYVRFSPVLDLPSIDMTFSMTSLINGHNS